MRAIVVSKSSLCGNYDRCVNKSFRFHGEQSDELTKLPMTLADALVARRQSKCGRDPTDQRRSWLANKIRTDIAVMGIKLNAQVIMKNLRVQNMHEKSLPPTGAQRRMEHE
jgi:hypothetical protein